MAVLQVLLAATCARWARRDDLGGSASILDWLLRRALNAASPARPVATAAATTPSRNPRHPLRPLLPVPRLRGIYHDENCCAPIMLYRKRAAAMRR